jgi:hypothetical protein
MDTKLSEKSKFNTEDFIKSEQTGPSETLPENVTEEPQDKEHMDLRKIKDYQKWLSVYLSVSDDNGEMLGNINIETEVKRLCEELDQQDLEMEEDPQMWVDRIKELTIRYSTQINFAENISIGAITKYRIRQGLLFNFQKYLVKERLNRNWTEWFEENYDKSLFRSVRDYMNLAKYPNVVSYAVFGKERLLQIVRQIGKPAGENPIGAFLEANDIDFDSYAETDYKELKIATDIAITRQKLNSEGLEEVADDKVEALVRNGIEITVQRLGQMKLVMETRGDLPGYIDRLIATGGKVEPIQTAETKAKSFKKTVDRFLDQTVTALDDEQYLGEVDIELCQQLLEKIQQLEQKLTSSAN